MRRGQEGYLMGLLIAIIFALAISFILMNAAVHVKGTTHVSAYYALQAGLSDARSIAGIDTYCIKNVEFSEDELIDLDQLKEATVVEILDFDNKCMEFLEVRDDKYLVTNYPGITDIRVTCRYLGIYRCQLECVKSC